MAASNRAVYVVDGARTPFLKARSGPGPFTNSDMAVAAGQPLLARQPFEPDAFDEVILGSTMPSPDEANIGRVVALRLGCGKEMPAFTVHRNCASGMQAIDSAAQNIITGRSDLVLAGGVDAMSHAPLLFKPVMVNWLAAWMGAKTTGQRLKLVSQIRPGHFAPIIALLRGLTDPIVGLSMGQTTEEIAHRFGISREEMDEYAARSHQRLAKAQADGLLDEIVPMYGKDGTVYDHDDGVRPDSTPEGLKKLRPWFDKKYGRVTAANSAQVTDGAAWTILASEDAVKKYNLDVLGRIVDVQWAGLSPSQMGLGPVHAITPILKRRRLKLDSIDNWEINEAFAGQVLGCLRAWEDETYCKEELGKKSAVGTLDQDKLNIHGGGISLGHPVGATGARIVLHTLHALKQTGGKKGIASLCIGGGQGGAVLVEAG